MVPARKYSILARIRKYFIVNYDHNEEHLSSAIFARYGQILLKNQKGEKTKNDLGLLIFPNLFLQLWQDQIL